LTMFTLRIVLTGGGPIGATTTLSFEVFRGTVQAVNIGPIAVYSIAILLANVGLGVLYMRLTGRVTGEEMLMSAVNRKLQNRATLLILAALVVGSALGPMLWAISTSLKNEVNAVSAIPSLIPSPATLSNYLSVFSHKTFGIELLNSILYAAGAVVLALAVGIPAGSAASRYTFPAKRSVMLLILATSMVPGVALLVPT